MFDPSQAREWLEILHGDSPGWINICSTGDWNGRSFPASDIDGGVAYIESLDKLRREGIYLRATTMRSAPVEGRGGEDISMMLPGLWGDIDIAGPGHKTKHTLPPDIGMAMGIVEAAGLPQPTHWIHSGGGLYPWWLLQTPIEIVDLPAIRGLSSGWQKALERGAKKLGYHYGTGVGDLARVLRIPGTINRKEGLERPCRPLEGHAWSGPTYTFEALLDALAQAAPEPAPLPAPSRVEMKTLGADGLKPGEDFNQRGDDWFSILAPHGWTMDHERGEMIYLTRPGKDRGISASLSKATNRLFVFTDATEFESFSLHTKFSALAVLEHGGSFSAAARELRARGFGAVRDNVDYGKLLVDSIGAPVFPSAVQAVATRPSDGAAAPKAVAESHGEVVRDVRSVLDLGWTKVSVPSDTFRYRPHITAEAGDIYAETFADRLIHLGDTGRWMFWNGKKWQVDNKLRHQEAAARLGVAAYREAKTIEDVDGVDAAKPLMQFAKKLSSGNKPMLQNWAMSNPLIASETEELDADGALVTVDNGVLNVSDGSFQPYFDATQRLTMSSSVVFDKDAHASRWEAFMRQSIPDEEMRRFLQKAVGYTLTGKVRERVLFLLHGPSGSGKSVFINVLEKLFGDFGATAEANTLHRKNGGGPTNSLNDLKGKRLVAISELNKGDMLDEALVKRLTGGDRATTRAMYEGNTTWTPQFTLFMATNHLPKLSLEDDAIWRRVKPILFPNAARDNGGEIKGLADELFEQEASGILNWVLEGLALYRTEGLGDPPAIEAAVAEYRAEQDVVRQFMDSSLEEGSIAVDDVSAVGATTLYQRYKNWATDSGHRFPLTVKTFLDRMLKLGYERERRVSGFFWLGLRLNGFMLGT